MASSSVVMRGLTRSLNPLLTRHAGSLSVASQPQPEAESEEQSSFSFSQPPNDDGEDSIHLRAPKRTAYGERSESSVTMPMSFMTGSIVGKRFYKEVKTREADDGNGWTVMLDYRTLKT